MSPAARATRRPRILVVRRDNIGDLVCTTPLIAALRARHPEGWLGALVNSYNAPVLAGNPHLDEVIAYRKLKHLDEDPSALGATKSALGALGARVAALWRLRRANLDWVVLATPDYSPRLVRLARWLAPKRVAGFTDAGHAGALDAAVPVASLGDRHEVERVMALAPLLGADPAPPPLMVRADPERVAQARAALPAGDGPVVAVHASARRPRQRWPAERYAALARALVHGHGARVLLLWSPGAADDPRHPGDDAKADEIRRMAGLGEALVPFPTFRLEALTGALAAADSAIVPDGGAMHLAAALGVPTLALFGDSPVARWRPWGAAHRVLRAESGDLADLAPEAVLEAWRALAGAGRATGGRSAA